MSMTAESVDMEAGALDMAPGSVCMKAGRVVMDTETGFVYMEAGRVDTVRGSEDMVTGWPDEDMGSVERAAHSVETMADWVDMTVGSMDTEKGCSSVAWVNDGAAVAHAYHVPTAVKKQRVSKPSREQFARYSGVKAGFCTLSEAVHNLIQNHQDVTGIVHVKRFTETICQALFTFTDTTKVLSLKDLNKIVRAHISSDVWLYTLNRKGTDQWIKSKAFSMDDFPVYGFEDPLLGEMHQLLRMETELALQRSDRLMDERSWFSTRKMQQMQYHAARTITAACANRFHLTTFVFLTTEEYNIAAKRLHSQFACTQISVVEFLVGYDGTLPPGHITAPLTNEVTTKETDSAMEKALLAATQAAGIVIVLCEVEVVRNLAIILNNLVSDTSQFPGAICFGYCVVVPFCNFEDSDLQELMDRTFLKKRSGLVPHMIIDLAQE
jgi:hypothetical protein